jgi:hypothetical protein
MRQVGWETRAVRDRAPRILVAPRATARDASRAGRGPDRVAVRRPRVGIVGIPVEAPLVDGAGEVREPEAVHGTGADGRRGREGPLGGRPLVAPRIARVLHAAPGGALPLGLGGETTRPADLAGEPLAVRHGLRPAHADDRLARIAEARVGEKAWWGHPRRRQVCRVLARRHRAPRHGERVDPHPPPGPCVRQAVLPAHPEPARGDRDEIHVTRVGRCP